MIKITRGNIPKKCLYGFNKKHINDLNHHCTNISLTCTTYNLNRIKYIFCCDKKLSWSVSFYTCGYPELGSAFFIVFVWENHMAQFLFSQKFGKRCFFCAQKWCSFSTRRKHHHNVMRESNTSMLLNNIETAQRNYYLNSMFWKPLTLQNHSRCAKYATNAAIYANKI